MNPGASAVAPPPLPLVFFPSRSPHLSHEYAFRQSSSALNPRPTSVLSSCYVVIDLSRAARRPPDEQKGLEKKKELRISRRHGRGSTHVTVQTNLPASSRGFRAIPSSSPLYRAGLLRRVPDPLYIGKWTPSVALSGFPFFFSPHPLRLCAIACLASTTNKRKKKDKKKVRISASDVFTSPPLLLFHQHVTPYMWRR